MNNGNNSNNKKKTPVQYLPDYNPLRNFQKTAFQVRSIRIMTELAIEKTNSAKFFFREAIESLEKVERAEIMSSDGR